jgi:glycine/D-amino acid oxidase-like deaminating enzyme
MDHAIDMDAVVFGGGAAGLWTLDELVRAGLRCVLLEAHELGMGQTVASQGILHGGLKYTLTGMFSASARAITAMPEVWRSCLAGESQPDLTGTRMRSQFCYLWQTSTLKSRLGMFGARAGLRVRPRVLESFERPDLLGEVSGTVARLDEQVVEPWSLVTVLAERHRGRVLKIDLNSGLEFAVGYRSGQSPTAGDAGAARTLIRLINPDTGEPVDISVGHVVLAAGAGNADLRAMLGLNTDVMQRRPLHMAMLRGEGLPMFNAHCVDGAATRVTITATRDFADRPVWQVGGQVAERGVAMDERALLTHVRDELRAVLPRLSLSGVQWASYLVDRAEAASGGVRPAEASVRRDGNIITAWPTKLVLAPRMASMVRALIENDQSPGVGAPSTSTAPAADAVPSVFAHWPRPVVALPPWETTHAWITFD